MISFWFHEPVAGFLQGVCPLWCFGEKAGADKKNNSAKTPRNLSIKARRLLWGRSFITKLMRKQAKIGKIDFLPVLSPSKRAFTIFLIRHQRRDFSRLSLRIVIFWRITSGFLIDFKISIAAQSYFLIFPGAESFFPM